MLRIGKGNNAERRQVRIGVRRPGEVEILEGLAAADRVITHGNDKVRPGQPVKIQAIDDGTKRLLEPPR